MTIEDFENLLKLVAKQLTAEVQNKNAFTTSKDFENRVREVLVELGREKLNIDFSPHPHIFPDICIGQFGVEVKFTLNDTWRSVANSVLESSRDDTVEHIYVLFGKLGGAPEVRWGKYEECVMHVRTSHVPRFEVEMNHPESLFVKMGVPYNVFCKYSIHDKMRYIREYARGRLKEGERLWWLEDKPGQEHTLDLQVHLYMRLSQERKRQLRAEGAILCPQIVQPSRTKDKYNDVVMYFLTYHGVLCPQARDLYSAGSVAMRADQTRGGNYVQRALLDIEDEMLEAAQRLEDALFVEYWGESVKPDKRIKKWLQLADKFAAGHWKPSVELFKGRR